MITRTFYLLAKQIVNEYEAQFHEAPIVGSIKLDSGLKRNDYVIYIGGRDSKYLTEGKKYRLTTEPWENIRRGILISVSNDKGDRYVSRAEFFKLP